MGKNSCFEGCDLFDGGMGQRAGKRRNNGSKGVATNRSADFMMWPFWRGGVISVFASGVPFRGVSIGPSIAPLTGDSVALQVVTFDWAVFLGLGASSQLLGVVLGAATLVNS